MLWTAEKRLTRRQKEFENFELEGGDLEFTRVTQPTGWRSEVRKPFAANPAACWPPVRFFDSSARHGKLRSSSGVSLCSMNHTGRLGRILRSEFKSRCPEKVEREKFTVKVRCEV